ncbi:hypothetical protein A2U01_0111688, partial [Trifolium medium]|nr:hypothetical protein [Trifolium medium]
SPTIDMTDITSPSRAVEPALIIA